MAPSSSGWGGPLTRRQSMYTLTHALSTRRRRRRRPRGRHTSMPLEGLSDSSERAFSAPSACSRCATARCWSRTGAAASPASARRAGSRACWPATWTACAPTASPSTATARSSWPTSERQAASGACGADGQAEPFCTHVGGQPLPPCNFVAVDREGRTWITVSTRLIPRALGYRPDAADGFIVLVDESRREDRGRGPGIHQRGARAPVGGVALRHRDVRAPPHALSPRAWGGPARPGGGGHLRGRHVTRTASPSTSTAARG